MLYVLCCMRVQSAGAGTAYEKPTPGLRQTPQIPRQVSDRTKERGIGVTVVRIYAHSRGFDHRC